MNTLITIALWVGNALAFALLAVLGAGAVIAALRLIFDSEEDE